MLHNKVAGKIKKIQEEAKQRELERQRIELERQRIEREKYEKMIKELLSKNTNELLVEILLEMRNISDRIECLEQTFEQVRSGINELYYKD